MSGLHWKRLLDMPEAELATLDVAAVSLACAVDLPDGRDVDVAACLTRVDEWAASVQRFTERMLPRFQQAPEKYNKSEAYFRILCMVTHLQRDLGLRYNPAKSPDDVPLETADTFIHGALFGEGGTCGSMAVIYTTIGRRLGYPLKLVRAKRLYRYGHLFPCWEGPDGERFNIEATNKGLACDPDEFYRTGIFEVEPDIERACRLLVSLTPKEELAEFLAERGHRWEAFGLYRRAVESFLWGHVLAPHDISYLRGTN